LEPGSIFSFTIAMKTIAIKWLKKPEEDNYPSALLFLSLIYPERTAERYVKALKTSATREFKAKDIFRASALPMLSSDNSHVKEDYQKIKKGEKISPLLLVRDSANGKVIIADGYHRLCAVHSFDEDALISCRIV
jgi:hypothetical protein